MERLFKDTAAIEKFRSSLLGPHLQQLAEHLSKRGYARGNSRWRIRIAYRFVGWLERSGIPVQEVTPAHVNRFVARYCSVKQGDARTLRMLLDILVENRVASRPPERARARTFYCQLLSGMCRVFPAPLLRHWPHQPLSSLPQRCDRVRTIRCDSQMRGKCEEHGNSSAIIPSVPAISWLHRPRHFLIGANRGRLVSFEYPKRLDTGASR